MSVNRFFHFLIVLINIFFVSVSYTQEQSRIDEISNYMNSDSTSILQKTLYAKELYSISLANKNDSIQNESLVKLIKFHYQQQQWDSFNNYRKTHINFALIRNDSTSLAKTYDYSGAYFNKIHQPDSAYFYYLKSFDLYKRMNDSLSAGKALLNTSILQKNIHDYAGSETTSFQALSYLENLDYPRRTSSVLNNLGIVYNQLKDLDNSLKFHYKALNLRRNITETKLYYLHSLNNIGKVHRDYGAYDEALTNFEAILQYEELLNKNPKLKAVVIDNYAFTLFKKGNFKEAGKLLQKALIMRDSLDDKNGIIISSIHLSEYYATSKDTLTAIKYAKRAESLAQSTNNYRDYLESLELMSGLYNTKEAKVHFKKYISIRDSLDLENRKQKESLYKIRYALNEKENIISIQKEEINSKSFIITCIICLVTLTLLLVFLKRRKEKRKSQILSDQISKNFKEYLTDKYSLTKQNIEFWEFWVTKLSQEEMADALCITENAVKSRRKSLKNKIYPFHNIEGNFDQARAILIYNEEKKIHASIT